MSMVHINIVTLSLSEVKKQTIVFVCLILEMPLLLVAFNGVHIDYGCVRGKDVGDVGVQKLLLMNLWCVSLPIWMKQMIF